MKSIFHHLIKTTATFPFSKVQVKFILITYKVLINFLSYLYYLAHHHRPSDQPASPPVSSCQDWASELKGVDEAFSGLITAELFPQILIRSTLFKKLSNLTFNNSLWCIIFSFPRLHFLFVLVLFKFCICLTFDFFFSLNLLCPQWHFL